MTYIRTKIKGAVPAITLFLTAMGFSSVIYWNYLSSVNANAKEALSLGNENKADISQLEGQIKEVVDQYRIEKVYVGISEGDFAVLTKKFVEELKNVLTLDVETIEEAVSTIEANQIFLENKNKKKNYKKLIDSIAAAVILRRVNTY